jgi:type III secretion system HrpE/YscL family protein
MARVIRADRNGPTVVPAAAADASERARAIVERAEAQAEATRDAALADARAQARAELAAQLLELAAEREKQLAALEPQVIQLALLAAKRIVGDELAANPSRVADLVAPLLARVRRARQVTLRVHPDDRSQLEASLAALRTRSELAGSLALETDPALGRGDCVVISDAGVLDARIDTQLHALARALGAK